MRTALKPSLQCDEELYKIEPTLYNSDSTTLLSITLMQCLHLIADQASSNCWVMFFCFIQLSLAMVAFRAGLMHCHADIYRPTW